FPPRNRAAALRRPHGKHPAAPPARPDHAFASQFRLHARSPMKRPLRTALALLALAAVGQLVSSRTLAQVPDNPNDHPTFFPGGPGRPDPRVMEFQNISKGAKTYDGLFKLYQKDENLYAELLPQHMNKQLLCPIALAKGAGMGGLTLNFEEQWV